MRVLIGLAKQIREWDRPSQIALVLALILLVIAFVVAGNIPELRTPAMIAIVGLLLSLQVIVLWGNRTMVTAYTQAQRLFLAGELQEARQVLEQEITENRAANQPVKVDVMVLLGNVYRNLGAVEESEAILREACEKMPDYHFALYGLGRTLLVKGDFQAAAELIQRAHRTGAPAIVLHDLAIAYYCMGDAQVAQDTLQQAMPVEDPARQLMAAYLGVGRVIPDADMLVFWEGELERFSSTPYGQFLQEFLAVVQKSD